MASRKKLLTSAVALGTAAVMLLGGTFAWQSISQTVVNEGSDIVNPGGRLHDDFNGTNKDVYVENFANDEIFARIRLEEYFKVAVNTGHGNYQEEDLVGYVDRDDGEPILEAGNATYHYEIFKDYQDGKTQNACKVDGTSHFTWTMGSLDSEDAYYMPTFNKNKDSLAADLNGEYRYEVGEIVSASGKEGDDGQYKNYVEYGEYTDGNEVTAENATEDSKANTKSGYEIYDGDDNTLDEVGTADLAALIDGDGSTTVNGTNYKENIRLTKEMQTHHTKLINNTSGLISMEEWLKMVENDGGYSASKHSSYWVYDTDGWVYWSAPIQQGATTGRLLDGIELNQVMDNGWYYAINVVAQFITANDMGQNTGTGFYATGDGNAPSQNALKLLEKIGVNTDGAESVFVLALMDKNDDVATVSLEEEEDSTALDMPTITVNRDETITLLLEGQNMTTWLADYSTTTGEDVTNSAVHEFRIGDVDGKNFTSSNRYGVGNGGASEYYVFDNYGALTLSYVDSTVTFTAVNDENNEAYEACIIVNDGKNAWHGMVYVNASGGDSSAGGGQSETFTFSVTDNDNDDTNNPVIENNSMTYTGPATEFTFAILNESGWTLDLNISAGYDGADYVVERGDNTITVYEYPSNTKGDQVATWDGDTNTLTMEPGKTLKQCGIEATKWIGEGSSTIDLTIAKIECTATA